MQSNYSELSHGTMIARMIGILDSSDNEYQEVQAIPAREKLTFTNGYYVSCTALFIDLRESSALPNKHSRPRLAKIYRSYISEAVAVINSNPLCAEVNIHGDAVWGVFDTPTRGSVDLAFGTAYILASMIETLNCLLQSRAIDPLRAGVGISYGRALMIKAGYSGSAINDVVWMGEVVNEAANLSHNGDKWLNERLMVSDVLYGNLNEHNQGLLRYNQTHYCWSGNVLHQGMKSWLDANC